MGIVGEIIFQILRAFLPWFFSGETKERVEHVAGLEDLRPDKVSGGRINRSDLPALCAAAILCLCLTGCAFGGAKLEREYTPVEPGAVVEIIDDRPIKVAANDKPGTARLTGCVSMPKSIYQRMREAWIENRRLGGEASEKPLDVRANESPTTP